MENRDLNKAELFLKIEQHSKLYATAEQQLLECELELLGLKIKRLSAEAELLTKGVIDGKNQETREAQMRGQLTELHAEIATWERARMLWRTSVSIATEVGKCLRSMALLLAEAAD
jgi:hypothetical protein